MIDYFKYHWQQTEEDQHVIDCMNNAFIILDVGCGFNQYKKYAKKPQYFKGIDIANEDADEVIDILDYKTDKLFDLIICYGSINFYDEKWVGDRLEKVINLLDDTPGSRICMKVNPGNPHADGTMLEFFPWTMDYARHISSKYGLVIENFRTKNTPGGRFKFDFVRSEYPYTKQAEDIYAFV